MTAGWAVSPAARPAVASPTNGDGLPTAHIGREDNRHVTLCGRPSRAIEPTGPFIRCEECRLLWIEDDAGWDPVDDWDDAA